MDRVRQKKRRVWAGYLQGMGIANRENSLLLKQLVRRAFSILLYRRQIANRILGIGTALTAKLLGLQRNRVADLHRRRTFQSIYRDHLWGAGEARHYFSGLGSRGEYLTEYVAAMVPLLRQHSALALNELIVVDLGCGDFAIGSALLKPLENIRYIGCDIVPELIAYNQHKFRTENIEFRAVDIVRDPLPGGHVCLLRQVLQHLSNAEIGIILPKLMQYKYVYVSEDQPLIPEGTPNPDKPVGADIRFNWQTGRGRGVELNMPPWDLTLEEVSRSNGTGVVMGSIVTYRLVFPRRPADYQSSGDRDAAALGLRQAFTRSISMPNRRFVGHAHSGQQPSAAEK